MQESDSFPREDEGWAIAWIIRPFLSYQNQNPQRITEQPMQQSTFFFLRKTQNISNTTYVPQKL